MLNELTLQDRNITIDWIGFKFQNLDNFHQTRIIDYLFQLAFNSY